MVYHSDKDVCNIVRTQVVACAGMTNDQKEKASKGFDLTRLTDLNMKSKASLKMIPIKSKDLLALTPQVKKALHLTELVLTDSEVHLSKVISKLKELKGSAEYKNVAQTSFVIIKKDAFDQI